MMTQGPATGADTAKASASAQTVVDEVASLQKM